MPKDKQKGRPSVVVVTGDVTIDCHLARRRTLGSTGQTWDARDCTYAYRQRGGAALVADLIEEIAKQLGSANYQVRRMAPKAGAGSGEENYRHSYAIWSWQKYGLKPPFDSEKRGAWRVAEYLGLDHVEQPKPAGLEKVAEDPEAEPGSSAGLARRPVALEKVVNDTAEADVVVLDAGAWGFRDTPDSWPAAVSQKHKGSWFLLKMSRPVAQGELWKHLCKHCVERLVVVVTVNDLRRTWVEISRELSWERTAQDVVLALVHNPRVNALARCAHVVVSFGAAGALLLSSSKPRGKSAAMQIAPQAFLFFDPQVIEGMWGKDFPGGVVGYGTCLTAGIALQLMLRPKQPDIHRGIQSGLVAMRALHREGYGHGEKEDPREATLAFPNELVARELAKAETRFKVETQFEVAAVPDPARFLSESAGDRGKAAEASSWSILRDRYPTGLDRVACEIVLRGAEVTLQGVPLGHFGDLLTVDRQEIESFRSIQALVGEYDRQGLQKPLSIAVFGSPGSGKSFAVTELAKSLLGKRMHKLEFNLSQFGGPEKLLDAFHQVRDAGLRGSVPLVFWDEFDTNLEKQDLGWLAHFLVPMQDGKFQQGQITHPIGRAIFVFAGGTSESIEHFRERLKAAVTAKGPDFASRIKGFANILGPNPRGGDPEGDPYYIIRRALLLRSIFQRTRQELFREESGVKLLNIDSGVLRALLHVPHYKHGVRSMESLITMSVLTGKSSFERSCLPAEPQLNLHVDGAEFLELVRQMDWEPELLERLAHAVHAEFCAELRARRYRRGLKTQEKRKLHGSLRPYVELPEEEKEQNRNNARDIANKLARLGYVITLPDTSRRTFRFRPAEIELMAEMEHDRWLKAKLAAGWRYAPQTQKGQKLHRDLRPWRRLSLEQLQRLYGPAVAAAMGTRPLSQKDKAKDRRLVRAIPRLLASEGYTVAKVQRAAGEGTKPR